MQATMANRSQSRRRSHSKEFNRNEPNYDCSENGSHRKEWNVADQRIACDGHHSMRGGDEPEILKGNLFQDSGHYSKASTSAIDRDHRYTSPRTRRHPSPSRRSISSVGSSRRHQQQEHAPRSRSTSRPRQREGIARSTSNNIEGSRRPHKPQNRIPPQRSVSDSLNGTGHQNHETRRNLRTNSSYQSQTSAVSENQSVGGGSTGTPPRCVKPMTSSDRLRKAMRNPTKSMGKFIKRQFSDRRLRSGEDSSIGGESLGTNQSVDTRQSRMSKSSQQGSVNSQKKKQAHIHDIHPLVSIGADHSASSSPKRQIRRARSSPQGYHQQLHQRQQQRTEPPPPHQGRGLHRAYSTNSQFSRNSHYSHASNYSHNSTTSQESEDSFYLPSESGDLDSQIGRAKVSTQDELLERFESSERKLISKGEARERALASHKKAHQKKKKSDLQYVREVPIRGGRYRGMISQTTGEPCGRGKWEFPDRVGYYDGQWKQGNWHGKGLLKHSNGDIYEGAFEDNTMHGAGVLQYADGRVFDGSFEYGEMVDGTMYYQDGSKYQGEFKDGKRNGAGTYNYQDGSVYIGTFVNDSMEGKGRLTWSNGGKYVGDWHNGCRHGHGREFRACGTIRYDGLWHNGRPVSS